MARLMPPSNDVVRRSSSATEKRGVMYLPGVNVARVVEEVRSGVGAAAEAWEGHVDGRSQPVPCVTSCEAEIEGRVMWSDSNSVTHSQTPPSSRRALFTSHSTTQTSFGLNRIGMYVLAMEWNGVITFEEDEKVARWLGSPTSRRPCLQASSLFTNTFVAHLHTHTLFAINSQICLMPCKLK